MGSHGIELIWTAVIPLIGVVLGFILALSKDIWNEKRKKKVSSRYLAELVAPKLDEFATACIDVVWDDGDGIGLNEDGSLHKTTDDPEFGVTGLDVNWLALPSDLMISIRVIFPTEIQTANDRINDVFKYHRILPNSLETFEERQYLYASLALSAIDLSKQLRAISEMPNIADGVERLIDFFGNYSPPNS